MKRVSITNIIAVLAALLIGAYCSGCYGGQPMPYVMPQALADHVFVDYQRYEPLDLHRGIYSDVAACIGENPDDHPVEWATARLIITPTHGYLAYGAFANLLYSDGRRRPTIILERSYVYHAQVIAHESIHAIARVGDGHSLLYRCMMYVPPTLPLRVFPRDSVEHYLALAQRG